MNTENGLGQGNMPSVKEMGIKARDPLPQVGDVVVKKGDYVYVGGGAPIPAERDIMVQSPLDPAYW